MATTQTQPETAHKALEIRKEVFDLDSKGMVTVVKVGDFEPVSSMEEFVSRLGNDAKAILSIVNDGLEKYTEKQLENDSTVSYQLVDEDENGNETLVPFTGTLLSAEKSKSLGATVINFAKLLFGYQKNMVPGNKEENRKAKAAAKESALAAILSNPAAMEGLRK